MNDTTDLRRLELERWLNDIFNREGISLSPVSGDASFRRYFRFILDNCSYIAVDAPPEFENSRPFVDVTTLLHKAGVQVPEIMAQSLHDGFFVISDFGDRLLLDQLSEQNADELYTLAIDDLIQIQSVNFSTLPAYDSELLQREMKLFSDWYLKKHRALSLTEKTKNLLKHTYSFLENSALQQPKVFVHRDYHSRNLMLLDDDTLGIIDFQDAVAGPITYDLVSLLRDCYIQWPMEKLDQWIYEFCSKSPKANSIDRQQFRRWFDLMGIQRHLKATGIFCRLKYRDNKHAYVEDIPRTLNYVKLVSSNYDELRAFNLFLESI